MKKGKLLTLPPPRPEAWCYSCRAMTKYRRPVPGITHPTPTITMREGICDTCGGVLWRVGGGRASEGLKPGAKPDQLAGEVEEDTP